MARCPFAEWRGPVPCQTPGGMESPVVGVVFHIMGASMSAADGWFHNPSSQVSAHFGIATDGHLVQWVDTDSRAWHAGAANRHWIGVETEGASGSLSEAGCRTFAQLYHWIHETHGVAYQITDDPNNGHGFGWHGMGGAAWGGHDYCPGPERKAQRDAILQLAQGQPPTPPQEDPNVADLVVKYVRHPAHREVFAYFLSARTWVQSEAQAAWQSAPLNKVELHDSDWSGWGIPIVGLVPNKGNGGDVIWPVTGVPA